MTTAKRKGAAKMADVPVDILQQLNRGEIEAATLVENLATDIPALLAHTFPALAEEAVKIDTALGITKKMIHIGTIILQKQGESALAFLSSHPADLVRGWGAYLVAQLPSLSFEARLAKMLPFADDAHFGVREWAWLAFRPFVINDPVLAIELLKPLAKSESENIRRFSIEVLRPRGVWSSHIPLLKTDPAYASSLLTIVKADPSRYVQDSVANWLHDAWKTTPLWVEQTCTRWLEQSNIHETQYIIKRALRSQ